MPNRPARVFVLTGLVFDLDHVSVKGLTEQEIDSGYGNSRNPGAIFMGDLLR